ncbi:MAG: hypothetical protein M3Z66_15705 [Chloroflexota bacterium]|nr:hypothetical protein [Chloroflexota bacterium]
MKRNLLLISLVIAMLAGILSWGAPQASAAPRAPSHAQIFDRTSFIIHMGLAFYAFHHYILSADRSGEFRSGAAHRKLNLAKAAVALLFTFHEINSARNVANRSSSKSLHALAAPLNALATRINGVYSRFNRGNFNPADITGMSGAVSSFGSRASHAGFPIRDRHITVPGA